MSEFKNVNVVYFYVTDWEAGKKFYRDTLGWPIAFSDEGMGWEEYGEEGATHIAINRWDEGPPPTKAGGATCTLLVKDAHQVTESLRAKGVRCDDVITIPGAVTYGTFYDPEGNRIQFVNDQPAA